MSDRMEREGKKETLYLDTSVPNTYFDDRNFGRMVLTRRFWGVVLPEFDVYVSEMTLAELSRTSDPTYRAQLLERISACTLLPIRQEAEGLAEVFLEAGVVPRNKREDALHLAVPVVEGMDVLVSWNFEHMVNFRTKRQLPVLCARRGYFKQLLIVSPQEFFRGA